MKDDLLKTALHDWHEAHGGKMVEFGGWRMPVQYQGGIIAEHLATRRGAGLFDVAHMGRFRVRGPGAEAFLGRTLTNNARGLSPMEAHYTFIATEAGGAVDDAYLYKLAEQDFLLVVNASNRRKDWDWLTGHIDGDDIEFLDESDELGMISLQGPDAANVLERLVDPRELPENKRNHISVAHAGGHPIVVARTGYTGEPVCFELFPRADFTTELWSKLVEAGATPVGLGARDSLRLEAGLPLYGHELGVDPDGNEIPLFANSLARFAVRVAGDGDYIGREPLNRQREEYIRIKRGELTTPVAERRLPAIVQPIAVFGSRRPLRAGYRVYLDDRLVGHVTSGTTVPYPVFDGDGITAMPGEEQDLRPIGLALLASDIRYRSDASIVLRVEDDRGRSMEAELVERNAWPTTPYVRAHGGFEAVASGARIATAGVAQLAAELERRSSENDAWRRERCVNLIPSENCTSDYVNRLCVSDPSGRYNEHNRLRALGPNSPDVRYYKGTQFIMDRELELQAALRTFFGCERAEVRVISGQMANDTVYDALKQFRNRLHSGRTAAPLARVLVHDLNRGGHLSAQIGGALKNYVAHDPTTERPAVEHFPMERDRPHAVDVEATKGLIARTRPDLIVFGRSVIIHREPVADIARFVHEEFGADNPQRPLIMYDGAHVLGLLGPAFQDPLAEGADVVTGSTHKTFFGPQRGVVLSNVVPGHPFEAFWNAVESRAFPGHVSNHHLGTLLGLLGATYEMIEHRDSYPQQVVANAKAFARALSGQGLRVEGDPSIDFTETHQVLLRGARARGGFLASTLEEHGVITNPQAFYDDPSFAAASGVRMGTPEMTRFGMKESDFEKLAVLVAGIVGGETGAGSRPWGEEVAAFRAGFLDMQYCF